MSHIWAKIWCSSMYILISSLTQRKMPDIVPIFHSCLHATIIWKTREHENYEKTVVGDGHYITKKDVLLWNVDDSFRTILVHKLNKKNSPIRRIAHQKLNITKFGTFVVPLGGADPSCLMVSLFSYSSQTFYGRNFLHTYRKSRGLGLIVMQILFDERFSDAPSAVQTNERTSTDCPLFRL